MSRPIRKKAGAVGVLALAAVFPASATASPQPYDPRPVPAKTLKYTCKYPLVDKQPLEILVTSNIPRTAYINKLQPAFVVNAVATAGGNTSQAITTLNAQAIDGVSQATASLHFPSGFIQEDLAVDLTVEKWVRPAGPVPNPLVLSAKGETPPVVLDELGLTDIVLDEISLNLRALKADGTPINVKKLTSDFDGNPVPPDTTPDDFNVYCKLNASESNVIASIRVIGDGGDPGPFGVTGLKVDSKTYNTVSLSWTPSTDPNGDAISYNVYRNGTKVANVTSSSYSATGLTGSTVYRFEVEPVDGKGAVGSKSSIMATTDAGPGPDTTPPSVPVSRLDVVVGCGPSNGQLSWTASTDDPNGTGVKGYRITRGEQTIDVPASTTSYSLPSYDPYTETVTVAAVDQAGNVSAAGEAVEQVAVADCSPPSVPGDGTYTEADIGEDYLVVRWTPSADDEGGSGIKGYIVESEGEEYFVPAGTHSKRFDGLGSDSDYEFFVRAVDNSGAESESLEVFLTTRQANAAPSKVTGLKIDVATQTSVQLSWEASVDPNGDAIRYDVYQGTTKVADVATTSATITGLAAATAYSFTVVAVDSKGAAAAPSDAVQVKVVEGPPTLDYALKGSTSLKTLTRGNLPLTGGIKAVPDFAAGTFEADLTLNNTSGRLVAGGFLPITAKVGFVPVGKTTGTLDDATATKPAGITTNSKVRIKVLEVKLFGAIPLAGGNNCQTKQASDITLKSTNKFDPFVGGSIAGTYKISDLNGCGALNGIVSPLTAGGGNTIALDLTYKGTN